MEEPASGEGVGQRALFSSQNSVPGQFQDTTLGLLHSLIRHSCVLSSSADFAFATTGTGNTRNLCFGNFLGKVKVIFRETRGKHVGPGSLPSGQQGLSVSHLGCTPPVIQSPLSPAIRLQLGRQGSQGIYYRVPFFPSKT